MQILINRIAASWFEVICRWVGGERVIAGFGDELSQYIRLFRNMRSAVLEEGIIVASKDHAELIKIESFRFTVKIL